MIKRTVLATTTALAMAAALPGPVQAKELRIALGLPDIYAAYESLVNFAATLESDVGLPAKVYAMSLLTLAETSGGLRDGLADIGFVVFPYHPVEFSEVNLVANLSMLSSTGDVPEVPGAAMTGAAMEYTLLNCPECLTQMKANNQVYLTGTSSTPYRLLCSQAITTAADVSGKRFRAGAANYARWVDALGGSALTVPGNETYDAMSQGIVDCTMSNLGDLTGGRFIDVTTHITMGAPGGTFIGLGAANVNLDVWRSLSTEQRAGMLKAATRLSAESVLAYHKEDLVGEAAAIEKGVEFIEGDESLLQATADFVTSDFATISEQFTNQFRVQNVDDKIATFVALVDKWKGLAGDIGPGDEDRLEELYWSEIVSKVDPATHGVD